MKNLAKIALLFAVLFQLAACQTDAEQASRKAAEEQLASLDWTKAIYVSPQWEFVGLSEDWQTMSFIHKAVKKTKKGTVIGTIRAEHKAPVNGVRSSETTFEYDCKEIKSRALSITTYKNANLGDKIKTVAVHEKKWSIEAPNSKAAIFLSKACAPHEPQKKITGKGKVVGTMTFPLPEPTEK